MNGLRIEGEGRDPNATNSIREGVGYNVPVPISHLLSHDVHRPVKS